MSTAGPPMPAPKFATARDETYPTIGGRQSLFAARMLAQPFMPHQQLIADVAGELIPSDDPRAWTVPGLEGLWVPRRKLVIVTEQRQAGKSHQSMAKNGERCFAVPNYRAWYTAQTGQDARDQFLKFEEENLRGTPLSPFVKVKRGRGEEIMSFPNGSTIRPHPPTEEKLHGKQSDANDIDEGWAFTEEEGRALLQAVGPTQLTRPAAQTWIYSAGGTAASTWLAQLVARGRGGDPDVAYFEWGIPDDADPEDMEVILEHHPAAGRTISRESLAALRTLYKDDPAGWARAAGNRWTEVIGGAIPRDLWTAAAYLDPIPDAAPLAWGAARSIDGAQVALAAAAKVAGVIVVEIVAVLPTAYGAAEEIRGHVRANPGALAVAPAGPSASLVKGLENIGGVKLLPISDQEYSAACANLLDALPAGGYRFRPHPDLDAAVKVAGKRALGDGGYVWARRSAGVPIAALEAATLAAHALARPRVGKPRLVTSSAA